MLAEIVTFCIILMVNQNASKISRSSSISVMLYVMLVRDITPYFISVNAVCNVGC